MIIPLIPLICSLCHKPLGTYCIWEHNEIENAVPFFRKLIVSFDISKFWKQKT